MGNQLTFKSAETFLMKYASELNYKATLSKSRLALTRFR